MSTPRFGLYMAGPGEPAGDPGPMTTLQRELQRLIRAVLSNVPVVGVVWLVPWAKTRRQCQGGWPTVMSDMVLIDDF
jgi:hypothetical protein